jgi:hypothetical protein
MRPTWTRATESYDARPISTIGKEDRLRRFFADGKALIIASASMVACPFTVETTGLEEAAHAVHREFFGGGDKHRGSPSSAVPPASSPAS